MEDLFGARCVADTYIAYKTRVTLKCKRCCRRSGSISEYYGCSEK